MSRHEPPPEDDSRDDLRDSPDDPRDEAYFIAKGFTLRADGRLCPLMYPDLPFTLEVLRRYDDFQYTPKSRNRKHRGH